MSVPPGADVPPYEIDPIAWRPVGGAYDALRFSKRGPINDRQEADKNLGSEFVAFGVGGMMQHWTAATPRHNPDVELYKFDGLSVAGNLSLWDKLYSAGENLLGTNDTTFDNSIRNTLVREALRQHYIANPKFAPPAAYPVRNLPMAVRRPASPNNDEFVFYTGTDIILDPVINDPECSGNLEILPEARVKKLRVAGDAVVSAELEDLMEGESYRIEAGTYVVASGAVMSAYILWNSGIALDVVGRYIIEHPIAFTQIILRQEIINSIDKNPDWTNRWNKQVQRDSRAVGGSGGGGSVPDDLHIPVDDPPPNVWIPVSASRPWHCQIHKDAFHYGALPAGIDNRLIVDLRWFCVIEPRRSNLVKFEKDRFTAFGTAQPTFEFSLSDDERLRMHLMMEDMQGVAQSLGAIMPGSEPKFMPKGLALHIQGTTRMGADPATSVVDENLKVHQIKNLYVGGNGIIPTANASNPTLTNVSLALKAAHHILGIPYP